jgi:mannosyl-glycoprotein endo-beta-N-acetylglucosaminidase
MPPASIAPPDTPPQLASTPADAAPHHLPAWVQTRKVAPLWSGPDSQAVQFTRLPAWTFLKVTGASVAEDRLQVLYAGDGAGRQPGPGWVAATDVQPSDAGGNWLRNYRASRLFADITSGSPQVDLPQWSWMVRLDDATAAGDRVHVRAYSPALSNVVGEGWVPASDVGPTGAPIQSVWTRTQVAAPPAEFGSQQDFIAAVAAAARQAGEGTSGAPVSVTVAQAILESDWGQSLLSREANNYFGIKASGELGNDGAVWMRTLEFAPGGGSSYAVLAPFRAYKTLADSVADHSRLFREVSLYRQALQVLDDPDEFTRRIAQAGYSTDPGYASKVIDLMHRYDLYQFDSGQPAVPNQYQPGVTTA